MRCQNVWATPQASLLSICPRGLIPLTMVLYFVRLIFLFLTFAFGVISGSLGTRRWCFIVYFFLVDIVWVLLTGASAEAKSNHEENRVTGFVPAALTIDTNVGGPFHVFPFSPLCISSLVRRYSAPSIRGHCCLFRRRHSRSHFFPHHTCDDTN